MKYRILSVIITFCLVLSLFSTAAFAGTDGVSYFDVFLDTSLANNGDGSLETPFNNVNSAIEAIEGSDKEEGRIYIQGIFTVNGNLPSHTKPVTFRGGTVAYNASFSIGGPTTFSNVSLKSGGWYFIGADGYPLTFDEEVKKNSASSDLNINAGASVSGKDIDLTILGGQFGSIYVGSYASTNVTVGKTSVTVGEAATVTNLIWGANSTAGVTFTDDVFITIGGLVKKMYYTTKGTAPVFEASVTTLYNNGYYTLYDFHALLADKEDTYIMRCDKCEGSYLATTDTPGNFTVIGDNEAMAVSTGGDLFESDKGTIKVSGPGLYDVSFFNENVEYLNGGATLKVKKEVSLDLSTLTYVEPDGKVFIGWTDESGKAVKSGIFAAGTVLVAQYVDCADEDFYIKETQIRNYSDTAKQGLRFVIEKGIKFEKALKAKVKNISFGSIYIPTDYSGGTDMEFASLHEISRGVFKSPKKVSAVNIFARSAESEQYTLCITDSSDLLAKDKYYKFYTVKGYVEFTDINGNQRAYYTDYMTSSLYKTALNIKASDPEGYDTVCDTIINYVENDRVTEKTTGDGEFAFMEWKTGPNADGQDENHASYMLKNGILVRDIVIGNKAAGGTPIEIAAFSDIHFNSRNKQDLLLNNPAINAQYEGLVVDGTKYVREMGRVDLGYGSVKNSAMLMEYGSFFDKTVVIGDIMDFFSFGSAELTKKLLFDRSINGSALFALGNHETAELFAKVTAARGFNEMFSQAFKYNSMNRSFWPHDIYYHSEVVTKADKKVKLVVLDNQSGTYAPVIATKLEKDIADSKADGTPILIFQHVPLNTYNSDYATYIPLDRDFGSKDCFDGNIYDGSDNITRNSSDATTRKVYNLIASNPDVIKGIFAGHVHNNYYTEVAAASYNYETNTATPVTDASGNALTIPQYMVGGSYMPSFSERGGASVLKISIY